MSLAWEALMAQQYGQRGSMGDWNQARDGATGTHTDAGGQCTDAIEAGISVMGWHAYYTQVQEAWRWVGEKWDVDAYVMPDWACRMAVYIY